ncbi:MAG: DUF3089 domain-containing protein, partial [Anaerovoracaceae bacterium]
MKNMERSAKHNPLRTITCILLLMSLVLFTSCSLLQEPASDYSKAENWLAAEVEGDKAVDVFYLYPTTFSMEKGGEPFAKIDDGGMRSGAKQVYDFQSGVFAQSCNRYAPYYRQVDAVYDLQKSQKTQEKNMEKLPAKDALAAFDYYIEHYNKGKPFILAGHSQGSNVLLYLLDTYMKEHPETYKRMVAAYVIGYSVTETYLKENPHLRFAQGQEDTGVIISYNTEATGVTEENPVLRKGAIAINPITWTRTEEPAPATLSKGSLMLHEGEPVKMSQFADAKVNQERGVVNISTADPNIYSSPENPIFKKGVFHANDYNFYYFDL